MYVPRQVIYWFVFVTGLPGNAIILAAYSCKKPKKSTDVLILIQAIVDFVACVNPLHEMVSIIAVCWFSLIVRGTASLGSLLMTAVIAVDRYMSICKPFGRKLSNRQAAAITSAFLVLALSINLCYYEYLSVILYLRPGMSQPTCLFLSEDSSHSPLQIFVHVIQVILFVMVAVVCLYAYINVYLAIKRQARVRAEMDAGNPSQPPARLAGTATVTAMTESQRNTASTQAPISEPGQKESEFRGNPNTKSLQDPGNTVGMPSIASAAPEDALETRDANANPEDSVITGSNILTESSRTATENNIPAQRNVRPPARPRRPIAGNKTTRMLLVVTVFMFLSWLPYMAISNFPIEFYYFLITNYMSENAMYFMIILRVFNHMINVFVYSAFNPVFRQNVKTAFIQMKDKLKF